MAVTRKLKIDSYSLGELFDNHEPSGMRVVVRDDGLVRIDVEPDRGKLDEDGQAMLKRLAKATGRGLAELVNDEIRSMSLYEDEGVPHGQRCKRVCDIFNGGRSDVWVAVLALEHASALQLGTDLFDADPTMGPKSIYLWKDHWDSLSEAETHDDEVAWFWRMMRDNYTNEDTAEDGQPSADAWIAAGKAALAADWDGIRAAYQRLGETPAEATPEDAWDAAARRAGIDAR